MLNVLCEKPSFTSVQKYGFHTGLNIFILVPFRSDTGNSWDSETLSLGMAFAPFIWYLELNSIKLMRV